MTSFNYNTKNLIIFQFPRYAGGKFVQNCLGLSDHMVFQKQSLAQAQIDGNFSFEDKKEYISTHMQIEDIKTGYWGDLRLGCMELFVQDDMAYNFETQIGYYLDKLGLPHYSQDNGDAFSSVVLNEQHPLINDTVKFLSSDENDNLLFCINQHSLHIPEDFFPNAKIITFKNSSRMTRYRYSYLNNDADSDKHWWHWDKAEIGGERKADFIWDTKWLNDLTSTVNGLKKLYKVFNLDGWEQAEPFIKEYYHLWAEKNYLPIPVIHLNKLWNKDK